jgi:predicted Kef-type K+ transport protein
MLEHIVIDKSRLALSIDVSFTRNNSIALYVKCSFRILSECLITIYTCLIKIDMCKVHNETQVLCGSIQIFVICFVLFSKYTMLSNRKDAY